MNQNPEYRFKYVVPFFHLSEGQHADSYRLINRTLCENAEWTPAAVDIFQENDLYDFVLHSMDGATACGTAGEYSATENRCICSVWRNQKLEKHGCRYINRKNNGNVIIDFDLVNVELYLFWNHVGFLSFEAGLSSSAASSVLLRSDVWEFQHHMVEIGQRQKRVLFGEQLSENIYQNTVFPAPSSTEKTGLIKLINQYAEEKYICREDLSYNGIYFDVKSKKYHIQETPVDADHTCLTVYKPLNAGLWIDHMITGIKADPRIQVDYVASVRPFSENPQKHIADKAIPFTYAVLNDSAQLSPLDESALTFKMASGYPFNYNSVNNPGEFWEHSAGVLWYASRQGCCCTVKDDGNGSYSGYFKNKIQSSKDDGYFLLFLLQLNQMYGLVYYSKLITERLTTDVYAYTKDNATLQRRLQKLHAEINLFLMKSTYTSISNIQKQNEFFSYLRRQLNIEQEIQSIQSGLEGLDELQGSLTQRETERRENTAEKRLSLSLGFLALLAVISAVTDVKALILGDSPLSFLEESDQDSLFCVILVIILGLAAYVLRSLLLFRSSYTENEVDIDVGEIDI